MIKRIAASLLLCLSLQGRVIIWDLGDVLVKNDKLGIAWKIGPSHFLGRLFLDWKSHHIKERFFEVLTTLDPDPENRWHGRMPDGSKLPPLLCSWMAGYMSGSDMVKLFDSHFSKPEHADFFVSDRERELMRRTIEVSFDPEI